jgi:hypothetical protein
MSAHIIDFQTIEDDGRPPSFMLQKTNPNETFSLYAEQEKRR